MIHFWVNYHFMDPIVVISVIVKILKNVFDSQDVFFRLPDKTLYWVEYKCDQKEQPVLFSLHFLTIQTLSQHCFPNFLN